MAKKKYKVLHYRDGCIGCGACAAVCEQYWDMHDDGRSFLKGSKLQEGVSDTVYELEVDEAGCNIDAEEVCPVQVIKVQKNK